MTRAPDIYVAASSKEIPRAEAAMRLVRELGGRVVGEWTEPIAIAGDSEGTKQTDEERAELSAEQLIHVSRADALVILIPEVEKTVGAWVELGCAFGASVPCVASCVAPRLPWAAAWVEMRRTDEAAVRRAIELAVRPVAHPLTRRGLR